MGTDDVSVPCDLCGASTVLMQKAPKVGSFPELLTFRCTECGDVRTIEEEKKAGAD